MFTHLRCTNNSDYLQRRDRPYPRDLPNASYGATYRMAHINRCLAMRQVFLAAGPAVDGSTADVFCQVEDAAALDALLRADPYVVGQVWVEVRPSPFIHFTEPMGLVEPCLDGSRRITAVEATLTRSGRPPAESLSALRDDGELAVGGVLEGDRLLAWVKTPDAARAVEVLRAAGLGLRDAVTRTMVWVL